MNKEIKFWLGDTYISTFENCNDPEQFIVEIGESENDISAIFSFTRNEAEEFIDSFQQLLKRKENK